MFGLFKKKVQGETTSFKISGMHCASCSMNIDGELEDVPGVLSATTSYATAVSKVEYDPKKVSKETLKKTIENLQYSAQEL
ncbi:MAG: cation transporter [Microgenomates group bacterium]